MSVRVIWEETFHNLCSGDIPFQNDKGMMGRENTGGGSGDGTACSLTLWVDPAGHIGEVNETEIDSTQSVRSAASVEESMMAESLKY